MGWDDYHDAMKPPPEPFWKPRDGETWTDAINRVEQERMRREREAHARQFREDVRRLLEKADAGMNDKRKVDCELIGGVFDGTKLELSGRPPAPHLNLPADGIPQTQEQLYAWLAVNPEGELLRYLLDWWDGAGTAKYRYVNVSPRKPS